MLSVGVITGQIIYRIFCPVIFALMEEVCRCMDMFSALIKMQKRR